MNRLLLFDLDGTLLRPDKTISPVNLQALDDCRRAGTGVAMGNGVPAVQAAADITIGPNDTDAIAAYLHTHILHAE